MALFQVPERYCPVRVYGIMYLIHERINIVASPLICLLQHLQCVIIVHLGRIEDKRAVIDGSPGNIR
jgi:hypothetical protein